MKTNYVDPVCRMLIINLQNAIHHPTEHERYFCSPQCLKLYEENNSAIQTKQNYKGH